MASGRQRQRPDYHAYRRKSERVELLGFAMPGDRATDRGVRYEALARVGDGKVCFEPGERADVEGVLVPKVDP
ncbi:MAG: hypothetical protein ACYSU0_19750 [Planctomycetota bacterium]